MKIDPYNLHPKIEKTKKVKEKYLKISDVYSIIDEELKRLEKLEPPTWGFTLADMFEVAENISYNVEKLDKD